jgi:hypothetical protein
LVENDCIKVITTEDNRFGEIVCKGTIEFIIPEK